mmetsp:Transcript_35322/g.79802  ORF Transcript_35322/g.79802 Transcript_35322/m.79802 type:complete len:215 (+) Transcript_35322:556-1200(+)
MKSDRNPAGKQAPQGSCTGHGVRRGDVSVRFKQSNRSNGEKRRGNPLILQCPWSEREAPERLRDRSRSIRRGHRLEPTRSRSAERVWHQHGHHHEHLPEEDGSPDRKRKASGSEEAEISFLGSSQHSVEAARDQVCAEEHCISPANHELPCLQSEDCLLHEIACAHSKEPIQYRSRTEGAHLQVQLLIGPFTRRAIRGRGSRVFLPQSQKSSSS